MTHRRIRDLEKHPCPEMTLEDALAIFKHRRASGRLSDAFLIWMVEITPEFIETHARGLFEYCCRHDDGQLMERIQQLSAHTFYDILCADMCFSAEWCVVQLLCDAAEAGNVVFLNWLRAQDRFLPDELNAESVFRLISTALEQSQLHFAQSVADLYLHTTRAPFKIKKLLQLAIRSKELSHVRWVAEDLTCRLQQSFPDFSETIVDHQQHLLCDAAVVANIDIFRYLMHPSVVAAPAVALHDLDSEVIFQAVSSTNTTLCRYFLEAGMLLQTLTAAAKIELTQEDFFFCFFQKLLLETYGLDVDTDNFIEVSVKIDQKPRLQADSSLVSFLEAQQMLPEAMPPYLQNPACRKAAASGLLQSLSDLEAVFQQTVRPTRQHQALL